MSNIIWGGWLCLRWHYCRTSQECSCTVCGWQQFTCSCCTAVFIPVHGTQWWGLGTFLRSFPSWCLLTRRSAFDLCTRTCVWQRLCPAECPPWRRAGGSSSCSQSRLSLFPAPLPLGHPSRGAAASQGCQGLADAPSCHFTHVTSCRKGLLVPQREVWVTLARSGSQKRVTGNKLGRVGCVVTVLT